MTGFNQFERNEFSSPWGGSVVVRSADDLDAVQELIDDRHAIRRAVILANLTARDRRTLMHSIEDLGVELREFTKADRKASSVRPPTLRFTAVLCVYAVVATPFTLTNRLRGRTDKIFEITPTN